MSVEQSQFHSQGGCLVCQENIQLSSRIRITIQFIRSNYLTPYNKYINIMKAIYLLGAILLLVSLAQAAGDGSISNVNQFSLKPVKKGTTFQATVWPCVQNNWAGRFSCNNCNPFEGDVLCNQSIPILCLTFPKTINRPYYKIAVQLTPFSVVDGGYYDGWTGGVFQVTPKVRGYDISSYAVGDQLCKGYYGPDSKFAQFNDGFYMPTMNQLPIKAWNLWDWGLAKKGGWNFWGFFNHHYRGRAWVWVDGQPNGNCGN